MATVDELIIGIGARDGGAVIALGKIIELLDRIADATDGNTKALSGLVSSSGKTADAVIKTGQKTVDSNKKLEQAGKKTVDIFSRLKNTLIGFLGATALFSFGKKMVSDIMKTDMALGALSRTTNRTVKDIQGLQNAWKEAGKDGNLASQSLQEWSNAVQKYNTGGGFDHRFLSVARRMRGLDVDPIRERNGEIRKYEDTLRILGQHALKLHNGDEKSATAYLVGNGMRADEADMAVKWRNLIDVNKARASATDESVEQAERMNQAYQNMLQRIEMLERQLVMKMFPYLERFLMWLTSLADEIAKDPQLLWDIVIALGACALAFGAMFNPIGTVIALVIGLSAVLYTATDRFKTVRLAWYGLMMAFKEGWNGVLSAIANVAKVLGFEGFAKNIESYKASTKSDEDAINRINSEGHSSGAGFSMSGGYPTSGGYSGGYYSPSGGSVPSGGGYDPAVAGVKDVGGVASTIVNTATSMGVDAGIALNIASAESGLNAGAKNPYGSAGGLFQFIDSTWNSIANSAEGRRYGLTAGGRYDPRQATIAMGIIMNRYKSALTKAGFPPNAENMYWCHFLGIGGAIKYLKTLMANPNMKVEQFFTAKQIRSNPAYLKVGNTLADTYALVTGKVNTKNAMSLASRFGASTGLFGIGGNTEAVNSFVDKVNAGKRSTGAPTRSPRKSPSNASESSNVSGNGFDIDPSWYQGLEFSNPFDYDMEGFGDSQFGNSATVMNSGNTKFTSNTTVHVTSKQLNAIRSSQKTAQRRNTTQAHLATKQSKKKL